MRLLVTRAEPDATRSANLLRARGHEVLVAPLLTLQSIDADIQGSYAAVLMTSANAARAAGSRFGALRGLPVFAVGDRSADAARESGFTIVESAGGALPDLVQLIATRVSKNSGPLLYLAGEDRSGDLGGDLVAHGLKTDTVVIYRVVPAEKLSAELSRALAGEQLDGTLHYSPRSAATFVSLADAAGALGSLLKLAHYCLSDAVAVPLREAGATRISLAPHPDETALFGLI